MTSEPWCRACGANANWGDSRCGRCGVPLEPPDPGAPRVGQVISVKGKMMLRRNGIALQEGGGLVRVLIKGDETVDMPVAEFDLAGPVRRSRPAGRRGGRAAVAGAACEPGTRRQVELRDRHEHGSTARHRLHGRAPGRGARRDGPRRARPASRTRPDPGRDRLVPGVGRRGRRRHGDDARLARAAPATDTGRGSRCCSRGPRTCSRTPSSGPVPSPSSPRSRRLTWTPARCTRYSPGPAPRTSSGPWWHSPSRPRALTAGWPNGRARSPPPPGPPCPSRAACWSRRRSTATCGSATARSARPR